MADAQWVPVRRWSAEQAGVPAAVAAVLAATGSLTRFLARHHGLRLDLHVHAQFLDRCRENEAQLLQCSIAAPCLRRRVALLFRGEVMFDAESVLPLEGLPTELMRALQDGKEPLGDLLIDRGLSLARSDLSLAEVDIPGGPGTKRWARRSVLRSPTGTCALVIECFRPGLWQRIQRSR